MSPLVFLPVFPILGFTLKDSKKVKSSNRNIQNGKWNVIMVSSGNMYLEIYIHILQAKNIRRNYLR